MLLCKHFFCFFLYLVYMSHLIHITISVIPYNINGRFSYEVNSSADVIVVF